MLTDFLKDYLSIIIFIFVALGLSIGFIILNFFGISKEIDCIVEDNKLKHGKFLPGMNIPILSKAQIKGKPDYAVVLAWNFLDEIKKKNSDLVEKFISIKDLEI